MGRGIAAVVDAIFLLLIAAIASGIVLTAAANYGKNFNVQAQKLLLNYYAKQVVRSIVTASIEREAGVPDYMLSFLKENVETFKDLGKAEEKLKEVIKKAMYPIKDRYDYVVMLDAIGTSWDRAYVFYRITTNNTGLEEEGNCVYESSNFDSFQNWVDSIGTELYTSSTTVFLRYCPGSCFYVPTDIRVMLFPRNAINQRPC